MRKNRDGSIEAISTVLIDDILEEYNINSDDINLPDEYMGETLSYVIMAEKEEFPRLGEEVLFA